MHSTYRSEVKCACRPFSPKNRCRYKATLVALIGAIIWVGVEGCAERPPGEEAQGAGQREVRTGLELRIVPKYSHLAPETLEAYRGAVGSRPVGDGQYLWRRIRSGTNVPPDSVIAENGDTMWLLMHNDEPSIMVPGQGWGLTHVGRTTDAMDRPGVSIRFDDAGAERLSQVTQDRQDPTLAILVDGIVYSAPHIVGQVRDEIILVGVFTEQEIDGLIATLKKRPTEEAVALDKREDRRDVREDELQKLLQEAISMPAAALDDARFTFRVAQTKPKWPEQPVVCYVAECVRKGSGTREYLLYSGTDMPMEVEKAPDSIEPRAGRVQVSDGSLLLTYYSTYGSPDTETQIGRGALKPLDDRAFGMRQVGIDFLVGATTGVSPLEILQDDNCVIHKELITLNGISTYMVECPVEIGSLRFAVTYWLAPDKAGLPVRMEMRDEEGNAFRTLQTEEFRQVGDIWFIKKSTEQVNPLQGMPDRMGGTTVYELTALELNPILDEANFFCTSPERLPVGTLFQDLVTGLTYTITEGPVSDETVQSPPR